MYPCLLKGLNFQGSKHEVTKPFRALDKREYWVIIRDNFYKFCIKTYVVTAHLNRLDETVQIRGHNIWL